MTTRLPHRNFTKYLVFDALNDRYLYSLAAMPVDELIQNLKFIAVENSVKNLYVYRIDRASLVALENGSLMQSRSHDPLR